ncbi:hypothetical protein RSAG8_01143, partial [Rhizoctonia solani AG-8 WAC10335]
MGRYEPVFYRMVCLESTRTSYRCAYGPSTRYIALELFYPRVPRKWCDTGGTKGLVNEHAHYDLSPILRVNTYHSVGYTFTQHDVTTCTH